ncbi:hypothetical protein QQ008_29800 [Fulvivirgaceae bacterium BMA10]|uniref:DUF4177 domain-containing protein n=1 Tax=Splendidivirga corallicola TaxID=3051826 RepID=A0ABT8KY08_9BACT|nr:hypothetical protein [Fulvivirgaceae bacterium BMA10]
MEFKVIPFYANISDRDASKKVADRFEELINSQSLAGWEYVKLENVTSNINNGGFFGWGVKSPKTIHYQLVVFKR